MSLVCCGKLNTSQSGAEGRINRDMVKMHLQKVYCMVLGTEMLRSTFGLVFSMNCFSLSDFRRRPSAAYWLCPFVFGASCGGEWIPDHSWDTSQLAVAPRKQWAAWRGAAKFKPCLELSALPRWALPGPGFTTSVSGPSAFNQAGQPEPSIFHPGEETWVEVQVSEQKGKANVLLTDLPSVTVHAGLGAEKAEELVSAFSGVSLVSRSQSSCWGWMWVWLISQSKGFPPEPTTVAQMSVLGSHPRCRVFCWCPGESRWQKQPGEETGLQQMGKMVSLLDRVAPGRRVTGNTVGPG